jgi:hypothetical protein
VPFASFLLCTLNLMKIGIIQIVYLILVAFICQLSVQSAILFFNLFMTSVKYVCRKLVNMSEYIFKSVI